MKMATFVAMMVLGMACLTMVSCTQARPTQTSAPASFCKQAESTMLALEHGQARAIDKAIGLMACYDGATAERVDVALGHFIARKPAQVFKAMHAHHLGSDMIASIAKTQPWKLVDKPCRFAAELKRRQAAIGTLKHYPRETEAAQRHLAAFIPVVSKHCKQSSSGEGHP